MPKMKRDQWLKQRKGTLEDQSCSRLTAILDGLEDAAKNETEQLKSFGLEEK